VKLPAGFFSRSATRDDLEPIVRLWDACDVATYGEAAANREGLLFTWGSHWFDLTRDTRVVLGADGTLGAYAEISSPDQTDRWEVGVGVHPDLEGRGLGSALLTWSEEEARRRGGSRRIWNGAAAPNRRGIGLLESQGYVHIRTFSQMRIDLDASFGVGPAPEGVMVRSHVPGVDDRAAFEVIDEAFRDHFGWVPESFEDWWAHQFTDESFDPALGFVAEMDGAVVGAAVNGIIDDAGWVYELGVRPAWQRRGIGRALLRASMAAFAGRGIRMGRLGVDADNTSGAVDLYRSIGMRPIREWRVYEKSLSAD
jgi:mycothiol synthase